MSRTKEGIVITERKVDNCIDQSTWPRHYGCPGDKTNMRAIQNMRDMILISVLKKERVWAWWSIDYNQNETVEYGQKMGSLLKRTLLWSLWKQNIILKCLHIYNIIQTLVANYAHSFWCTAFKLCSVRANCPKTGYQVSDLGYSVQELRNSELKFWSGWDLVTLTGSHCCDRHLATLSPEWGSIVWLSPIVVRLKLLSPSNAVTKERLFCLTVIHCS